MAGGNVNTPAALWELGRQQMPPGEWPPALVVLDMRFWDDPIACGGKPRPPQRELAETWGWSKGRAQRFITEWDKERDRERAGADVGHRWGTGGAPVGHERGNRPTANAANRDASGQARGTDGAPMGRERGGRGAVPKGTRARSSPSLVSSSRSPSPQPPARGAGGSAPPADLVDACHELLVEWQPSPGVLQLIRQRDVQIGRTARRALIERHRLSDEVRGTRPVRDALILAAQRDLSPPRAEPELPLGHDPEPPPPAEAAAALWAEGRPRLVEVLGHQDYEIWLRCAVPVHVDARRMRLWLPNVFYAEWVGEHHLDELEEVLGLQVELVTPEGEARAPP